MSDRRVRVDDNASKFCTTSPGAAPVPLNGQFEHPDFGSRWVRDCAEREGLRSRAVPVTVEKVGRRRVIRVGPTQIRSFTLVVAVDGRD